MVSGKTEQLAPTSDLMKTVVCVPVLGAKCLIIILKDEAKSTLLSHMLQLVLEFPIGICRKKQWYGRVTVLLLANLAPQSI